MKKILLLALVLITGCSLSRTTTNEKFTNYLEKKEYKVENYTSLFPEGTVESVLVAQQDKTTIEFYTYKTDTEAKEIFDLEILDLKNLVKAEFEEIVNNKTIKSFYSIEDETNYYSITRIKNTYIKLSTTNELKKDALRLLKDLGY